jgi:RimJ/RimL family protein N-acetyltransferase
LGLKKRKSVKSVFIGGFRVPDLQSPAGIDLAGQGYNIPTGSIPMETKLKTKLGAVVLRPGRESDAAAYRALRLEALRSHPEAFSADYAVSEARPMAYWKDRLRSVGEDNTIVFAIHGESLIGMCAIFRGDSPKTRHSATLVSVYLLPEWRGLGIAAEMIGRCTTWARERGITIVKLGVAAGNAAAIRCYARCGFTQYGVEPQAICVNGTMHDEVLMVRSTKEAA